MRQSKNIHFVTYRDSSYLNSKQRLLLQAKAIDRFCGFHVYGREDLDEKFISSTLPFINLKRGGGYWIWKPYIINKTLINLKHGDYLVYMDVGCTIRKSGIERFDEYIDMLDKNDLGCLSFEIEQELYKWNKEEIYEYFNIDKNDNIRNSKQLAATVIIIKKNNNSKKIITEWLKVAVDRPDLFSDNINKNQDLHFIENRHDQSIFDIIRKKYGSIVLPQEMEFNNDDVQYNKFPICATRLADNLKDFQIYHQTTIQLHHTQGQLHHTQGQLHHTQGQLHHTQGQLQQLQHQYSNNSIFNIITNRIKEKLVHEKWAKYPKPVRYVIYALKLLKMGLQKMV